MKNLKEIMIDEIVARGPMTIARYMELCLAHPVYGYYQRRDPFGVQGDFTTAPEISQLFGEMIGVWCVENWIELGAPDEFILCEAGPGRGTLMADILRATTKQKEFQDACAVHFIETSPYLREMQKDNVPSARAWHDDLNGLPQDVPILFIANEFFDALPIRQFIKWQGQWHERCIGHNSSEFIFGVGQRIEGADCPIGNEGDIFEYSPVREYVWQNLCARLKNQKGAALVIDYGHLQAACGDTFQAIKNHQYVSVLEYQGEADLTTHVDFERLHKAGQWPVKFMNQRDFLQNYGIEIRAQKLIQLNPERKLSIEKGLRRLIDNDQMGELFKVMVARF